MIERAPAGNEPGEERRCEEPAMSDEIDQGPVGDEELIQYLAESLPATKMARIEKALRGSAELRARLELARDAGGEVGLHTLGAIWRRGRLSCPSRQDLGSFLLDALDPDYTDFVTFHIETAGCAYCQANLADLRSKQEQATSSQARRQRYFASSQHLLSSDD
jgi:hypothetical protein